MDKAYDVVEKKAYYNLEKEIELARHKLNSIIIEKNENLLDQEVIKLSEELDELIVKFQYIKSIQDNCLMNLKNIMGTHSIFYYYGKGHLFANMIKYIKVGVDNNEVIYISMQHELYEDLKKSLNKAGIQDKHLKFQSVKQLIDSNNRGGVKGLKEKIEFLAEEEIKSGYSGIRWIGQPTYAIEQTSKQDFLNWEINLSGGLRNTKASLICIYDYYDYINIKKVIDEEVIKKSINTHSHILEKFFLRSTE
ncbi:MEDS domain-containing protein [Tepidibacter hydrothermalis]|uniref:MEDS domain-containing protein n=1 Tax=Tepidibacter hydrothermalis TaxID=3036126 RepID=A0ABY8EDG4_9FIRM|nr:MEDS domain-containing protein [Tepidibacter hydrothermalis]WFD10976.1 MEDS domain-containing protein [Tepidibacter hydrothermalis]